MPQVPPIKAYVFDAYGTLFDVLFVSSNAWDVAGAKAFGYRVAWCNRANAAQEELGFHADLVVTRLDQLPE